MRPLIASLFVIASSSAFAQGAERLDELFASWQETQRNARSLVVEFTQETKDPIYQTHTKYTGTLRLLRTEKGDWLGSYETTEVKPKGENQERWSALLNDGIVYLLNHDRKTAFRFEPEGGDVPLFLEKFWHPIVVLLNRQHAEEKCTLSIFRKDDWYTYLDVKPKQARELKRGRLVGNAENFQQGQVVLTNDASEEIPNDMPRQLWYRDAMRTEYTFKIKAWRLNPRDASKPEEFTKPEDRPGWQVSKFGLLGKK